MIIRAAKQSENKAIAPLLFSAMEDIIFSFIGENSSKKAIEFLEIAIEEEETLYSYKNCIVVEDNSVIIAAVVLYDGSSLHKLREGVAKVLLQYYNRKLEVEDETSEGEIYIDSIGVDPSMRGKGIGSLLFNYLIDKHVVEAKRRLALLVDRDNNSAKRLYLSLGFKVKGIKKLTGKPFEHMVCDPSEFCNQ